MVVAVILGSPSTSQIDNTCFSSIFIISTIGIIISLIPKLQPRLNSGWSGWIQLSGWNAVKWFKPHSYCFNLKFQLWSFVWRVELKEGLKTSIKRVFLHSFYFFLLYCACHGSLHSWADHDLVLLFMPMTSNYVCLQLWAAWKLEEGARIGM